MRTCGKESNYMQEDHEGSESEAKGGNANRNEKNREGAQHDKCLRRSMAIEKKWPLET